MIFQSNSLLAQNVRISPEPLNLHPINVLQIQYFKQLLLDLVRSTNLVVNGVLSNEVRRR